MAEPAAVRRAYREALRAVARHVSPAAGNVGIRDFVKAQFRRRDWGGAEEEQRAVEAGREWAELVNSIHAHKVRASPPSLPLPPPSPLASTMAIGTPLW